MRTFQLYRREDATGVSGTGIVAEGVMFGDGRVALRWCVPGSPSFTNVGDSIDDVRAIHGHGGLTDIVWIDERRPGRSWWSRLRARCVGRQVEASSDPLSQIIEV